MALGKILIMGVGNWLMQDEGVGVHVARSLESEALPEGVDVVDGGTGGFHLLQYFLEYKQVILVDATLDENPIGTIRYIQPKFAADFPQAMSTHDIGLKDLISALKLLDTQVIVHLFVVSIKSIQEQGIELSAEAAAVVPEVKQKILELMAKLLGQ